jgi:predicted Zn-dependent protease
LQYVYKAGYDPTAFINVFEKLEAQEKRKPGTMSELFRSHPNVESRIKSTQTSLQELLPKQTEYVFTTSEFDEMRQLFRVNVNRRKIEPGQTAPTLRRRSDPGGATESDERPTLKRRTDQ